jgi:hypothetical protein
MNFDSNSVDFQLKVEVAPHQERATLKPSRTCAAPPILAPPNGRSPVLAP